MQPTRCHISMILEKSLSTLRQLVPTIVIMFVSLRSLKLIWIVLGIAVLIVLAFAYLFLLWRKTFVFTDQDQLTVTTGVFWKKQTSIPYDKINTVDMSRNVLQRVLGTCRLKVDTGAVKQDKKQSELDLVFSLELAQNIRKHILSLVQAAKSENIANETQIEDISNHSEYSASPASDYTGWQHETVDNSKTGSSAASFFGVDELEAGIDYSDQEPTHASYQAPIRSIILYALTKSKIAAGLLALFSLFAIFDEIIDDVLIERAGKVVEQTWEILAGQKMAILIIGGLILIIAIYLLANILTMIITFVRFYHFRVRRSSSHIYIRYGLLTEKSYSLPVHNVHAIIIRQNVVRQKFKLVSVEIQSIGYGDDNKEAALLFPLVRGDEVSQLLLEILPEYAGRTELSSPPRRALRRFILLPSIFISLIIAIPSVILFKPAMLALIPILPLVIVSRYLAWRNSAIGYNSEIVELRNGSWHRTLYRIRTDAVQTAGTKANPLMTHAKLAHVELNYHAPVLTSSIQASFLDNTHLPELRRLLTENE